MSWLYSPILPSAANSPAGGSVAKEATDGVVVTVSEQAVVALQLAASDDGRVSASESAAGTVQLAPTDAVAAALTEVYLEYVVDIVAR